MKKIILLSLVIITSIVIIVSFFMPWVRASTSVTKVSEKVVSGLEGTPVAEKFISGLKKAVTAIEEFGDIKTVVSGYDIPKMVNNKSSKIAISFTQVFFGDVKDLDKKSMLVYLMPLFAIVCVILAITGLKYKSSIVIMAVPSGVISLGGIYNLSTAKLSSAMVQITIEKGLWLTLYGYLIISILSILWLIVNPRLDLK